MLIADIPGPNPTPEQSDCPLPFAETLLEALPIGVCTLDADGAVLRYNSTADRLCGGALQADGRLRIVRIDGNTQAFADSPLAYTIRTGRPGQNVPLLIERSDASPASVLATIEALRSDTGQITGAIVCLQADTPARQCDNDRRRNVEWLSAPSSRMPPSA
jgi:PAS domain-containing protein